MLSAFRIIFSRRLIAVILYVGMAIGLFSILEPRTRFQLTDEERNAQLSFTPDGKWLIAAIHQPVTEGGNTTGSTLIRLRDLASGEKTRALGTIGGVFPKIIATPDSAMIVASAEAESKGWRVTDGHLQIELLGTSVVEIMRFEPQLTALCHAVGKATIDLDLVDLKDNRVIAKIGPVASNARSIVLNRDRTKLATWGVANGQTLIRVWNVDDGKLLGERMVAAEASIAGLCFGPADQSFLWIHQGTHDGTRTVDTVLHQSDANDPAADTSVLIPSFQFGSTGQTFPWQVDVLRHDCAVVPEAGSYFVGSQYSGAMFRLSTLRMTEQFVVAQCSPDDKYLSMTQAGNVWNSAYQIIIKDIQSQNIVYAAKIGRVSEDDTQIIGWSPDSRYLALCQHTRGGSLRWLKQVLKYIKINFDIGSSSQSSIQLVSPTAGKIVSSATCEDPKSIRFAPDGKACVLDGYVYDVPFRKPWWAILGLPAVLALLVWRPYGKKKQLASTLI